jgi:putative spermidine/putrescine transport system substrate-binding protein
MNCLARPSLLFGPVLLCVLALAEALLAAAPAAARDLVVVSAGGALGAAEANSLVEPFVAAGTAVAARSWQPSPLALEMEFSGEKPLPDVIQLRGDLLRQACAAGRLARLNWDQLGRDKFAPAAIQDCGMGTVLTATALAWNRAKYNGTPGWTEFWDIARVPGKRALPRGPRLTLEIALLADGVAPADIYKVLRTDDGVDRAFRKLDQLRPFVAWWHTGADAARMLVSGEALLAAVPTADIAAPPPTPIPAPAPPPAAPGAAPPAPADLAVQWTGALTAIRSWAIRARTPMQDDAMKFLAAAADPATQARILATTQYAGLNKPPPAAEDTPLSTAIPAHLAGTLAVDEQFWRDNLQRLSDRFEAWLRG